MLFEPEGVSDLPPHLLEIRTSIKKSLMRIAFTSYEYPPETGGGGIGTYLQTASRLLLAAGHTVVVFSGTKKAKPFWENEYVFRIPSPGWKEFDEVLPRYFIPVHEAEAFDVLECTDFQACGLSIKMRLPELPVVVRLHTPLYMVDRLLYRPLALRQKLRFLLGSLKKMRIGKLPGPPEPKQYQNEFRLLELAELVSSPSQSIYEEMIALGFDLTNKTAFVPLPFDTTEFATIEARKDIAKEPHIVFIGRLEYRKGVIDLANAIPKVLKQFPGAKFTFIGESSLSPKAGVDMQTFLKTKLKRNTSAVSFTGKIPRHEVTKFLSGGDIFVFPSHYESFGLVCCEAMAAGKAVIGSKNGGMTEIIEDGRSGMVIDPKRPELIASAITNLLAHGEQRLQMGAAARTRIINYLSPAKIIAMQVNCYQKAIDVRKQSAAAACAAI
jgi:glycogen synthase